MIDIEPHFLPLPNILVATVCGALLGLEREWHGKPTGLRTTMLIALGSALFTLASVGLGSGQDRTRIAAQIVSGIGFLGAGSIMRQQEHVTGLTSAAMVWVVAAIGMLAGAGMHWLAISATLLALVLVHGLLLLEEAIERTKRALEIEISLPREHSQWLALLDHLFAGDGPRLLSRETLPSADERVRERLVYVARPRQDRTFRRRLERVPGLEVVERDALPMD